MKRGVRFLLLVLAMGLLVGNQAVARCHGGSASLGGGYRGGVNPAGRGYSGAGRYPLRPFATPLRPWGGITPVRQFLFGRGAERRISRRMWRRGY